MVQPKGCGWEDEEIPLWLITPESVWVPEKDSSIVSIEFESKSYQDTRVGFPSFLNPGTRVFDLPKTSSKSAWKSRDNKRWKKNNQFCRGFFVSWVSFQGISLCFQGFLQPPLTWHFSAPSTVAPPYHSHTNFLGFLWVGSMGREESHYWNWFHENPLWFGFLFLTEADLFFVCWNSLKIFREPLTYDSGIAAWAAVIFKKTQAVSS